MDYETSEPQYLLALEEMSKDPWKYATMLGTTESIPGKLETTEIALRKNSNRLEEIKVESTEANKSIDTKNATIEALQPYVDRYHAMQSQVKQHRSDIAGLNNESLELKEKNVGLERKRLQYQAVLLSPTKSVPTLILP